MTADIRQGAHRAGGGGVTVLVPAHNEADAIIETLESLELQTRRPDRVIVIADNCTDATEQLAADFGAEVISTVGNTDKKAGALNFALNGILADADPDDLILVQDADSQLSPDFIENAMRHLSANDNLGAVGGVFRGGPGGGFVGHLQRNEYARYARDVKRLHGKCLVVTGTAALFRVRTLQGVSTARIMGLLPAGNGHGGIYDTSVLTEDNELSFALLTLGYSIASPADCTLVTEVMPTWRELWAQRLRWKRGAVENCVQYGWTKITSLLGPPSALNGWGSGDHGVFLLDRRRPWIGSGPACARLLDGCDRRLRDRTDRDSAAEGLEIHAAGGHHVRNNH
ncbi:glycosyltransferase family 2 protein [Arthrobacter alpinus]|nr:glycosyltransferase family 2 protein [Arthrobacter alpinus]